MYRMSKNHYMLVLCVVIFSLSMMGCSQSKEPISTNSEKSKLIQRTAFEELDIPKGYDIKKFDGMTLNFIVENNLYANILLHESEEFSKVTGININILNVDYDTLFQKLNVDFISRSGKYQVVYVDPYQTLNRFFDYLEPLNQYNDSNQYPSVEGFPDDFFEFQVNVISYFSAENKTYAIPFDTTTMILFYRKDIFQKYREQFMQEKKYDWMPNSPDFTWEHYIEISEWIDENVPEEEVKYGSGHMAQEHNSIFCDFSNVLSAYGGKYFNEQDITTIGQTTFRNIAVKEENFIEALDMYKKIIRAASPESENWNWTDSAEAFRNGEIAMMPNWDENSSYLEDINNSRVAGKVGYSILPRGPYGSANIYGGSGIGINKYISEEEKEAAWLFITWATSKEMQEKVFTNIEGGNLPVRQSHYYDLGYAKKNEENRFVLLPKKRNISSRDEQVYSVLESWTDKNIYLRPKISNFYEVEKVLTSSLHAMIEEDLDPVYTSYHIYNQLQLIKLRERDDVD